MTSHPRDATLLAGPTAGQWDFRGKVIAIAGIAVLVIAVMIAAGLNAELKSVVAVVAAVVCLSGLALGTGFVAIGVSKKFAELRAGYSTVSDEAGVDLRHPRTGALIRARTEPVAVRGTKRVYDGVDFPLVGPNHPRPPSDFAGGDAGTIVSDGASTTDRPTAEG